MKFGIDESKSSDFKNDEMEGVDFRNGCPSPAISRSAACKDYVKRAGPLQWHLMGMVRTRRLIGRLGVGYLPARYMPYTLT